MGSHLYCTSVHREKYHIPIHGNLNGNRNRNVEQYPVMGSYILKFPSCIPCFGLGYSGKSLILYKCVNGFSQYCDNYHLPEQIVVCRLHGSCFTNSGLWPATKRAASRR